MAIGKNGKSSLWLAKKSFFGGKIVYQIDIYQVL
jgi:hypothetical protein